MKNSILILSLGFLLCAGCVTTAKNKTPYDPSQDVSPIRVEAKYKPAPLKDSELPFDSGMAMAAIAQMVRGETPVIEGLTVAPGIALAEPGLPLESFNFVDLTILDRMETEKLKGKIWETKTMALLSFVLGQFKALVVAEAFCTVTSAGVELTGASVHSLSPAQPRVAAWFVPKKAFLAAIEGDDALPIWDVMALADSMAVRVGPGLPAANDDYLAVAITLDRLQPGDTVVGGMCPGPVPDARWGASVKEGVGFPVLMSDVDGPLNTTAEEQYMHVIWRPVDNSRSAGADVPIGRFSTCGTVLKPAASSRISSTPTIGPLESGERFLDPKNSDDAQLIQQRLAELGFYTASVDGVFGKGSRAALVKFQKTTGTDGKGNWDLPTQQALFAGSGH